MEFLILKRICFIRIEKKKNPAFPKKPSTIPMPGIFGRVWCDRPQYARLNGRQNGRTRVEESFYIEPSEHTQPCIRALSPPPPSSGRPNYRSVSSSLKPDISPPPPCLRFSLEFTLHVLGPRIKRIRRLSPPVTVFPRLIGYGDRGTTVSRLSAGSGQPRKLFIVPAPLKKQAHTRYIFFMHLQKITSK